MVMEPKTNQEHGSWKMKNNMRVYPGVLVVQSNED